MGCIPVLISDYTVYPYQEMLDWTRFAVFIRESEIPLVGEFLLCGSIPPRLSLSDVPTNFAKGDILSGFSMQQKEDMQLALTAIARTSFLYHDAPAESVMGPYSILGWTLKGLYLRRMAFAWDDIYGAGTLPAYALSALSRK